MIETAHSGKNYISGGILDGLRPERFVLKRLSRGEDCYRRGTFEKMFEMEGCFNRIFGRFGFSKIFASKLILFLAFDQDRLIDRGTGWRNFKCIILIDERTYLSYFERNL